MALHPQAQGVLDVLAALGDPPLHEDTPVEARALADLLDDGQSALAEAGNAISAALA